MKVIRRCKREEFVVIRNDETYAQFRNVLRGILQQCKTNHIIIHLENFDDDVVKYYLNCKSVQYARNYVELAFIFVPIKFYQN